MSSTKVEKSSLVENNDSDELDKMPSRFAIRWWWCDVIILIISFVFTILVATFTLFHINNNQQRNAMELENIIENILNTRAAKLDSTSEPRYFERKRGYLEENDGKSKRSINDYRAQSNG